MVDEPQPLGLEGLPSILAQLGRATAQAGAEVVRGSLPGGGDPTISADAYYAIRSTELQFRFLLVRQQTQVVLFFHKRKGEVRPLAGTVQLQLAATDERFGEVPFAGAADAPRRSGARAGEGGGAPQFRLRLPAFIDLAPSLDERVRYAPSEAAADSLVLFRIGPGAGHRLAIALDEDLEESDVVYFDGVRHDLGGAWLARPFVELAAAIRGWLAELQAASGPLPSENILELDLGQARPDNDALRVIHTIVAAYSETEAALPIRPPPPGSLAAALVTGGSDADLGQAGLLPGYEIAGYRADVQLRLGPDGLISSEGEAVSLAMQLAVARRASGLVIDIALLPPDFLLTGTLFSQFVEALRSQAPGRDFPPDLASAATWSDLVRSAQAEIAIFRIERREEVDEELIVLPSRGGSGGERVLLLSVDAVIDRSTPVPRVKLSKLRLRYDSTSDADQAIDEATARYFLRLAQSLHTWTQWTGGRARAGST